MFNVSLLKINRNNLFFNFFNCYIFLNNKLLFVFFNLTSCYNFLSNNYRYISELEESYNNNIILNNLNN